MTKLAALVLACASATVARADGGKQEVDVPFALVVARAKDQLEVGFDTKHTKRVTIAPRADTILGHETIFTVTAGDRELEHRIGLGSGTRFDTATDVVKPPAGWTQLVIAIHITIFETGVRPQHMWDPRASKYRVLWEGDVTRTITPGTVK